MILVLPNLRYLKIELSQRKKQMLGKFRISVTRIARILDSWSKDTDICNYRKCTSSQRTIMKHEQWK